LIPPSIQGAEDGDNWKYLFIFVNTCVNQTDEIGMLKIYLCLVVSPKIS